MTQGEKRIVSNRRFKGMRASLFLFTAVSLALAEDPLRIADILYSPGIYLNHHRTVMIRGVIRELVEEPPGSRNGRIVTPCRFLLDDGTGAIEVHVLWTCRLSKLPEAEQSQFNVTIHAVIVSGLANGLKNDAIVAVAKKMTVADKHDE